MHVSGEKPPEVVGLEQREPGESGKERSQWGRASLAVIQRPCQRVEIIESEMNSYWKILVVDPFQILESPEFKHEVRETEDHASFTS